MIWHSAYRERLLAPGEVMAGWLSCYPRVAGQRLILNLLARLRRGEHPQLLHQIWAVSSIPALDDFAFDQAEDEYRSLGDPLAGGGHAK